MVELRHPLRISPRLLPAVEIDGCWISVDDSAEVSLDGRPRFLWYVDLPDGQGFEGDDLFGPACGREPERHEMIGTLLSFLSACAESYPDGESADLFPEPVARWAADNEDAISMTLLEIGPR